MITGSQKQALKWLQDRGGDAAFDRNGVAIARGETAPHVRGTWNKLSVAGLVEYYNPSGKGRGRMRLTDAGRDLSQSA
jgi:hypothetical protein